MTKQQLIQHLRKLATEMAWLGVELDKQYPHKSCGDEMLGASNLAKEWANEMEKEE